jgi:hypothetical protein
MQESKDQTVLLSLYGCWSNMCRKMSVIDAQENATWSIPDLRWASLVKLYAIRCGVQ